MISALGEGIMTIADGPEMPSINDFLPDPFVFQGTPFAINRIILVRILATVIMLLVLGITASRAKLIPSRWQGAVEHAAEWTLLIKTTASHFEAVVEAVRERHGYDCPEIVATEIIDASDDYRRWLVAQVADIDSPSA